MKKKTKNLSSKKIIVKSKLGKKPKKRKPYFGKDAHNAVSDYQKAETKEERNNIYVEKIKPSFEKLAENLIFIHGFSKNNEHFKILKSDCVTFLYEILEKFDVNRGTKAFSYFNVCAKNYLIIANNANYAKMKRRTDLSVIDDQRDLGREAAYSDYQESLKDFTNQWVEYYDNNLNVIFSNKRDIIVADTLLELFRIRDNIENFNKKALYILIRERTGLKTQNITKVVNVMKRDFAKMYQVYQQRGFMPNHKC